MDAVSGKRRRVTVGTYATTREAEVAATTQVGRGTLLKPESAPVRELLDRYLERSVPCTVRPENRQAYESAVNKPLKPALGNIKVRALIAEPVEGLCSELQNLGYLSPQIRKCHLGLNTALRLAQRRNTVHVNLCDIEGALTGLRAKWHMEPDRIARFSECGERR